MSESANGSIQIFIMGSSYRVPAGLTIMSAMEHAGWRFTRGAGCRSGFCGACSTVYRFDDDYRLKFALACQTAAEDGMYLVQLPFTPAPRTMYDLGSVDPAQNIMLQSYPEIARCVSCNTCSKACPQDIAVMDYIQAALRGDYRQTALLSFDCIQCGLCSMRCPADIKHYHVGLMARRIYARYLSDIPEHLVARVEEIGSGAYAEEMDALVEMEQGELEQLYAARTIE